MQCAKILVVDPDQAGYEPLKPALARHGYEIHTATTTSKALQLAGVHGYKAALISISLLCDNALLSGLQTELPALPVIVILSPETRWIPAQIVDAIDNSMGKPLTLEPVRLMLDRTLELALLRSRLRQQRQSWWDVLALQLFSEEPADVPQPSPAPLDDVLIDKLRAMVPSMEALGRGALHRAVLSYVEKLLLTVVLTECRGNQVKSADILGINRNTLRKKMRELKISPLRRSV
jgi:DNA-binding NtrC family response regulator